MRILVLAPQPFFELRGTPIAVRMLVETLAEAGHEVDLLVFHEGENVSLKGARLHRIIAPPFVADIPPGFSLKKVFCDLLMIGKAVQLVRHNAYDVIHAVEESAFIAWGLRMLTGIPYVFDMDSSMPQQIVDKYSVVRSFRAFLDGIEARVIRGSNAVVAVCKTLQERVNEVAPAKPVLRLEDVSMLNDAEVEENLRRDLAIEGALVMYVGNLEPYQGIGLLIDAFQRVCEEPEEAHLVLIGGSEPRIDQYRTAIARRGLSAYIHLVGPRPLKHLGAYLRQADVLVSPRTQGTNTPMKIYSYLDAGRPVVATRKRTHTQVLDDDIAMLAAPTPTAMAHAIVRLIRDEALRTQLASRARKRVAQEYSPDAFRRKLLRFYQLLERKLSASAGQPR